MNYRAPGDVILISCYELGHQPMGVALPAGFLERAGFHPAALDISVEAFDVSKVADASFVGISVPMHTALRLGVRVAEKIREVNPDCHICFYGLYAALNSDYLLEHGADSCIGGEYERPLVELIESIESTSGGEVVVEGVITRRQTSLPILDRLDFATPARSVLPTLDHYARLEHQGQEFTAGYAEASRGCLHLCTHCPIPPVYGGRFFIVPQDVVLNDIRQQVTAGAKHITFGDPDFLNGPKHSLKIVKQMHEEFPELTFDFTAKVEHLLTRGEHMAEFAEAGCLFIISAVESLSDRVLTILDKQHTREDVVSAFQMVRDAGIALRPTWVSFTPWTTLEDFQEVLSFVEENGLIDHVDPVQYSVRLLIPPGSWLAEHEETLPHRGPLDESSFTYRWEHPDPRMDQLQREIAKAVEEAARTGEDVATTFYRIMKLAGCEPAGQACATSADARAPRLSESWFC